MTNIEKINVALGDVSTADFNVVAGQNLDIILQHKKEILDIQDLDVYNKTLKKTIPNSTIRTCILSYIKNNYDDADETFLNHMRFLVNQGGE